MSYYITNQITSGLVTALLYSYQGPFSIFGWVRSRPMKEDLSLVMSAIIGWKLAQASEENKPRGEHCNDIIMGAIASQITSLMIIYSILYSDADQRKHQSSASLAFVQGIHREPVNSLHKWPVKQILFPFDDVIMSCLNIKMLSCQCKDSHYKHKMASCPSYLYNWNLYTWNYDLYLETCLRLYSNNKTSCG